MVPSLPFIPLLRTAINIKESATKHAGFYAHQVMWVVLNVQLNMN